jgi:copper chaperone
MTCGHCQQKVERALQGVAGVYGAAVDHVAGTAQVESGDEVTPEMLIAAVERAGYRAAIAA